MNYIDESNVQSITVTNVTTGGRETFSDFDKLADQVALRGHDLIQMWGQDGVLTLTFEVDYAEAEPEVEADAYHPEPYNWDVEDDFEPTPVPNTAPKRSFFSKVFGR